MMMGKLLTGKVTFEEYSWMTMMMRRMMMMFLTRKDVEMFQGFGA